MPRLYQEPGQSGQCPPFSYLVGKLDKQPGGIGQTKNLSRIMLADLKHASLDVGKTADPFQMFLSPGFLIFPSLIFSHLTDPSLIEFIFVIPSSAEAGAEPDRSSAFTTLSQSRGEDVSRDGSFVMRSNSLEVRSPEKHRVKIALGIL